MNVATTLRKQFNDWKRQLTVFQAYHRTLDNPDGQLVVTDILIAGGLLESSHTLGDAYDTAFREGRRSMALHVIDRLRWSNTEIVKLANEQTAQTLDTEEAA
jgi:hypothetical protein